MNKLIRVAINKLINAGTPQLLMGAMWLYLWAFPWRPAYLAEPHWGHNYTQSIAFLCVGLAYFNRRLISDWLALAASFLVIPAALELAPHMVTAGTGAVFAALIIIDIFIERGRKDDLGQSSNRRLTFWLKKHLIRFAFILLAHIAFIHFAVRLPGGTYETDLVTKVFNAMYIVFAILALTESSVDKVWGVAVDRVSFFWGMLTIIVSLVILSNQPETRIVLAISVVVTVLAVISLIANKTAATSEG